jgi:hypothetical protein
MADLYDLATLSNPSIRRRSVKVAQLKNIRIHKLKKNLSFKNILKKL